MDRSRYLLFWVLTWASQAVAVEPQGLDRLVDAALAGSAQIKGVSARAAEAQADVQEARRRRLPTLSARSSWTRGDQPVYVFGSLLEQGRFGPGHFAIPSLNNPHDLTNIKSGLDVEVPLFTGFDLTSAVQQRNHSVEQARSLHEEMAQTLRWQVASAYLQLLFSREILNELEARLAASKNELADARRLRDRGVVLGSDFYAAQTIYGSLAAWKAQATAQERAAHSELELLTKQNEVSVAGVLSETGYALPSKKDASALALAHHPELRAAASRAAQAGEITQQARRSVWPRVEGFASLETNTNDFHASPSSHLYGVAARVPFGDPGYGARRSRAAYSQTAALEAASATDEAIQIETSRAYETYQAAAESLPTVKQMADDAATSLELFRPLYRSGRQSILEVLRAEEALAKAKAAYWQTLLQLHSGYLQLMKSLGMLDDQAVRETATRLGKKP